MRKIIVIGIIFLIGTVLVLILIRKKSRLEQEQFLLKIFTENVLDGSSLVWENSEYVRANFPNIDYDIAEKRELFQIAKNLPPNYSVIDVGAHIGDLAVPLAKALANTGRSDVMVYAIDPSPDKCEFAKRMAKYNHISNITVLNIGLSDLTKKANPSNNSGMNTGATVWKGVEGADKSGTPFFPADSLNLGPVGLYHIDVEGAELEVLKGSEKLIRAHKPIIALEIWIEEGKKCRDKKECPEIFSFIEGIDSSYRIAGFLSNGDMILDVK